MRYLEQIKKFIGVAKYDEFGGGYIWGVDEKDSHQMLAQVNDPPEEEIKVNEVLLIRGWGAIQHMFKDESEAAEFQDELGRFIAEAINEKISRL
jgi:hypothetical protein